VGTKIKSEMSKAIGRDVFAKLRAKYLRLLKDHSRLLNKSYKKRRKA
jgi:hypothetical protein